MTSIKPTSSVKTFTCDATYDGQSLCTITVNTPYFSDEMEIYDVFYDEAEDLNSGYYDIENVEEIFPILHSFSLYT